VSGHEPDALAVRREEAGQAPHGVTCQAEALELAVQHTGLLVPHPEAVEGVPDQA
jgi:hypothetical protein